MSNPKGWKAVIEGAATEVVAWIGNDVVIAVTSESVSDGTNGTLVGHAGPGSLLIDRTNKKLLMNTGTKSSPTWTEFEVVSGD